MLALAKIDKKFFDIPQGLTQSLALYLLKNIIAQALTQDRSDIITGALPASHALIKELKVLFDHSQALPDSPEKKEIYKQIRFFVLTISNRSDQFKPKSHALQKILALISKEIGTVPLPNPTLELPAKKFLPKNYAKTAKKWESIRWATPGRSASEKVEFLKNDDHPSSSARAHLLELNDNPKHPNIILSCADARFYDDGNIHIDHFQSSHQIIERQQEIIDAMNIDPIFKEAVMASHKNHGYFKEENVKIFGTKRYFMECHNHILNLWPISAAENSGQGKGNTDPILWLQQHPRFGNRFFNDIGGKDKISQEYVFYTINGEALVPYIQKWFLRTYQQEIAAVNFAEFEIKTRLINQVTQIQHERMAGHSWKKESAKFLSTTAIIKNLTEDSPPKTPRESSEEKSLISSNELNSSDLEIQEKNLTRTQKKAAEKITTKRQRDALTIDLINEAREKKLKK